MGQFSSVTFLPTVGPGDPGVEFFMVVEKYEVGEVEGKSRMVRFGEISRSWLHESKRETT
jgi:hypothetical protein